MNKQDKLTKLAKKQYLVLKTVFLFCATFSAVYFVLFSKTILSFIFMFMAFIVSLIGLGVTVKSEYMEMK